MQKHPSAPTTALWSWTNIYDIELYIFLNSSMEHLNRLIKDVHQKGILRLLMSSNATISKPPYLFMFDALRSASKIVYPHMFSTISRVLRPYSGWFSANFKLPSKLSMRCSKWTSNTGCVCSGEAKSIRRYHWWSILAGEVQKGYERPRNSLYVFPW